jgi:hypothetical protein
MQDWFDHYFLLVLPFFFVGVWTLALYLIALTGGWRLLAKRFRAQGAFLGQKWKMQSARMRWNVQYNNALTVGATQAGLFLVPFVLFRTGHPALFIPWIEITCLGTSRIFFFKFTELRLGSSEKVPFKIRASLAADLQAAAGPSWPSEQVRTLLSQPPPIV